MKVVGGGQGQRGTQRPATLDPDYDYADEPDERDEYNDPDYRDDELDTPTREPTPAASRPAETRTLGARLRALGSRIMPDLRRTPFPFVRTTSSTTEASVTTEKVTTAPRPASRTTSKTRPRSTPRTRPSAVSPKPSTESPKVSQEPEPAEEEEEAATTTAEPPPEEEEQPPEEEPEEEKPSWGDRFENFRAEFLPDLIEFSPLGDLLPDMSKGTHSFHGNGSSPGNNSSYVHYIGEEMPKNVSFPKTEQFVKENNNALDTVPQSRMDGPEEDLYYSSRLQDTEKLSSRSSASHVSDAPNKEAGQGLLPVNFNETSVNQTEWAGGFELSPSTLPSQPEAAESNLEETVVELDMPAEHRMTGDKPPVRVRAAKMLQKLARGTSKRQLCFDLRFFTFILSFK